MIFLAFYKGRGRWDDRLIRWATRSRFSHVELLRVNAPPADGDAARAVSASGRDGGVRCKTITFRKSNWEFLPVPWVDASEAHARAVQEFLKDYDYKGILLSQVLAISRQDPSRWFCSELCAYALGLPMPHTYSPGQLYRLVRHLNAVAAGGSGASAAPSRGA